MDSVNNTAELLEQAARHLRRTADSLDRIVVKMIKSQDLNYGAEGINELINCLNQCQISTIFSRAIEKD